MKKHNQLKYRSGLEKSIAKQLSKAKVSYLYEPKEGKIEWVLPASIHKYTLDFAMVTQSGKIIIIETKGIWDYEDRLKHLIIKRLYPKLDIRFIFNRSLSRTSKGSKQTYADICNGKGRGIFQGITWKYADKKIPTNWFKE
jgi:hypothetical protein